MSKLFSTLSRLRDDKVLSDLDVEFSRFLTQDQEITDEVLLAGCLASYLYRQGNVCVPLKRYAGRPLFGEAAEHGMQAKRVTAPDLETWISALGKSEVVGNPGDMRPLILDSGRLLYLQKSWYFENRLAAGLLERAEHNIEIPFPGLLKEGLKRLFPPEGEETNWQKVAAVTAMQSRFTVISGGPGTGKTTTTIRFLALMIEQAREAGERLNIGLAAPTGKAAARLKEAILENKPGLNCSESIKKLIPDKALTLHRLLGARFHSSHFRYNQDNPLPHDLVVVDEASMVDQAMMSKLSAALPDKTRLVLLGDKDQLSSVEAGSALGDICRISKNTFSEKFVKNTAALDVSIPGKYITDQAFPLTDHIVLLTKSYRFAAGSGIGTLAANVNTGSVDQAVEILQSGKYPDVSLESFTGPGVFDRVLNKTIETFFGPMLSFSKPDEALSHLSLFKLLCAHRRGRLGTEWFNDLIEKQLKEQHGIPRHLEWYPGRPVLITQNDYSMGLRNGDIGITMGNSAHDLAVYFEKDDDIAAVNPVRLSHYEPAWAMTVHKSQGSEFDEVVLCLPRSPSKILTRELIYTAITRSRKKFTIWGNPSVLKEAISIRLDRSSGLKDKLWN